MLFKHISHLFSYKITLLFVFIVLFSIVYMFLDDKHFSGVNFIKDAIKEEVIKKKIEKKVDKTLENFTGDVFSFKPITANDEEDVDTKIDRVAEVTEQEVKEQDLSAEKIETSYPQKLFDRFYFSINTTTLLGYGDIYPVTNICKSLAMTQSLLTIFLIVV